MRTRSLRSRPLLVEMLEDRRLLSGTPALQPATPPAPPTDPAPAAVLAADPSASATTPGADAGTDQTPAPAGDGTTTDTSSDPGASPIDGGGSTTIDPGSDGNPAPADGSDPSATGTGADGNAVPVNGGDYTVPPVDSGADPSATGTSADANAVPVDSGNNPGGDNNLIGPIGTGTAPYGPVLPAGDITVVGSVSVVPIDLHGFGQHGGGAAAGDTAGLTSPADATPGTSLGGAPAAQGHKAALRSDHSLDVADPLGGAGGPTMAHASTSGTERADGVAVDKAGPAGPDEHHATAAADLGTADEAPVGAVPVESPGRMEDAAGWQGVYRALARSDIAGTEAVRAEEGALGDFAPQGAGALGNLGALDGRVLEQGLRQFLSQLDAAGASLARSPALLGMVTWLAAGSAAAVALEVGRRQLRRAPGRAAWAMDGYAWSWFSTWEPSSGEY
jgi:hypothetical protein